MSCLVVMTNIFGDDTFDSAAKVAQFEVKSIDQAIEINAPEYDDTPEIIINLPRNATGNLTINVDGTNYTATLVNESANVTEPTLSEGEHNITAYSGNGKYPLQQKHHSQHQNDLHCKIPI